MSKQQPTPTGRTIHRQLQALVTSELEELPELLRACPAPERVRYILQLLPYTTPKVETCNTQYGEDPGAWFGE